ncbi:MAG TPA: M20/M25/M40 family metallo-hydrolase [Candidatus Saccharimonadales bacterium]|nr:M20/M25/M40 family metallo-hydrolase [Candidatus Saccharimonadales bacterium]
MNSEQLIEKTKQLIAIQSIADNPRGLQDALDFIVDMVTEACPDVTIEYFESNHKPSILAYRGPARPDKFHIILNGHVDVVPGKPEQYQAYIQDDRLYGRGVYDMKAACVVMAAVFCEYVEQVPYALGLQIATDEELGGQHGTLQQIQRGVRGDFVICGECGRSTTVYEIANEAKGIARVEVGFMGANAHGAYPWKGDNALAKAVQFSNALLAQYPIPAEPSQKTTISITGISVEGGAINQIPDNARVAIDARYTADDPNFTSIKRFAAHLADIDPNARIVRVDDYSAPLHTDPRNPLLLSLKAAAERVERKPFSLVRRHASSDGRLYGSVQNEACEFGIAGEHQHGDGEYIPLAAFNNYLATMREFLQKTIESEKNAAYQPAEEMVDVAA